MTYIAPIFISHGAPDIILSDLPAKHFLETMAAEMPRPKAIVTISAHFEHKGVAVVTDPTPGMIYDFGGFPDALRQMRYAAPGSPNIAAKATELLSEAGFAPDAIGKRGYDHGVWNPLILAYPEADIPVVQISVDPSCDAQHHFSVGQALAPLADEDILILGSGHITHNLRGFFMRGRDAAFDRHIDEASAKFVDWMHQKAIAGDVGALLKWKEMAPFAQDNHPEAEHLMPFFTALGAGTGQGAYPRSERIHHSVQDGFFAYDHYRMG